MKIGDRSRDLFVANAKNMLIMMLYWIDLTGSSQLAGRYVLILLLKFILIGHGNLRIVGHLKMHVPILIQPSQLLFFLLSLHPVAHADDGHDYQDSYDGSDDGCTNIGWFRTVVIVAIGVFIDAVGVPLWTVSIKITAAAHTILVVALSIVTH